MQAVSTAELRKFGLTVGGVFLVLGTISWYRGHTIAPRIMWALGVLLVVPGLLAPAVLRPVQKGWMGMATVLGEVNSRIILGVLFFLVVTPIGFVMRLFGDPLRRSLADGKTSNWIRRAPAPVDRARYERQF
jgi:Saxitoxin biosynthesis operon protein SxtJ